MPRTNNGVLAPATARSFKGGLDVADSQMNLSSKFSTVLDNLIVNIDGSLRLRQGCRLFSDLEAISDGTIINLWYYMQYIIAVNSVGQVFSIDGTGAATRIWDSAIAAAKRPGLVTWGPTKFVSFLEFSGELILSNGTDKPLLINNSLIVDYLADKATGSNINVPIGLIMEKFSNHAIIADGSIINVSERGASGTYLGDVGVQLAGQFDLASYVLSGSTIIQGLLSFKGFLLVQFRECVVPIQFTEITTPNPALTLNVSQDSVIAKYGALSSRTVHDIGDQALSCDIVGIASQALSKFTKILDPSRPSRLIDPLLQAAINAIDTQTLFYNVFSVFDSRTSIYSIYFPNESIEYQTASKGFAYRYIDEQDLSAWSTLSGWNWSCGTRSSEGRMFFARANSNAIFVLGHEVNDPIYADYVGEQETFSDGTTFTDQTGFSPVVDVDNSGVPIKWTWELPWSDLKARANVKTLRYVVLDTEGTSPFSLQVFIDRKYVLQDGGEAFTDGTRFDDDTGFLPYEELPLTPATELEFVGADHGGYGIDGYGDRYGSGNNTAINTLTLNPTKGTILKLRFEGESIEPLRVVGITMLFQLGSIRRMMM